MDDLLGRAVAAEERVRQLENEAKTVTPADPAAEGVPGTLWSTRDPRETINKRARIIVIAGHRVVFGEVETKHGYCVSLDHNDPDERRFVAEDEPWPGWFWAFAPRRS